jgi:FAD/FMN-containing dehydrogenase
VAAVPAERWEELRDRLDGGPAALRLAGEPGYDDARRPAVARFDGLRPAAVARCASPSDVARVIDFARRGRLAIAVRSGGHDFAGRSSTDGVLLDVSPMASVAVDPDGVATVGAGARLGAVYDALLEHGVTIPAGCGPTVGIAGLTLGGGIGILGRAHGLTSDSLLGARVVLTDGRVVDCDAGHEPDLLWALRGAGHASVGVVTALRFATLPAPAVTSFELAWPPEAAVDVAGAWQSWAPAAPRGIAASLHLTAGADPAEPPGVRVFGAGPATEGSCRTALSELVEAVGARPDSTSIRSGTHREIKRELAGGEDAGRPDPSHPYRRSEYFAAGLPAAALGELVERLVGDRTPGQARELDFSPLGGAYDDLPAAATAFAHRGDRFLLSHEAALGPDAAVPEREAAQAWVDASRAAVRPWGTGRVYPNFPEPGHADPAAVFHGANAARVARLRDRYDPDGVLRPYAG